jgi:hypothetical protein
MDEGLRIGVALTGEALEITPTEATEDEVAEGAAVVVAATEAAEVVEPEEEAAPEYRAGPGIV